MLDFSLPVEFNRRALISDLKHRIERALSPFHQAFDDFLATLFRDMLPTDWRDRWRAFAAQQAAQGFTISDESVAQMELWIEAWAKDCWLWEATPTLVAAAPAKVRSPDRRGVVGKPGVVPNVPTRGTRPNEHIRFFHTQMDRADACHGEIKRALEELGRQLEAAAVDEHIDIDRASAAIEQLIWEWNDLRESAREAWLQHDLHDELLDRFDTRYTPRNLGVPYCLDDGQYRRAQAQTSRIGERLKGKIRRMDQLVFAMQVIEVAGAAAGWLMLGGVIGKVVVSGSKWAFVKTAAVVGTGIVADRAIESGLRELGVSDEVITGARLASAVITFILLKRRNASGQSASQPLTSTANQQGAKSHFPSRKNRSPVRSVKKSPHAKDTRKESRPGSVSGNPENRLVETGVPRKDGKGWKRRWTRMTRQEELAQTDAIWRRYEEVVKEAKKLPIETRKSYIFEQMRIFRTEYRRAFLKERGEK